MGWSSGGGSRERVIASQKRWQTVNGFTVVAIKTHSVANEDWFLYEVRTETGATRERFIGVTIWDGKFHKEMEECVGPHYYGCPVEWLDHVPQPEGEWCAKWRAEVRARNVGVIAHG